MKLLLTTLCAIGGFHIATAQSVFNDKTYGIINDKGVVIKQIEAKHCHNFSNERARISLYAVHDNKATFNEGFIDPNGTLVIPAIYEEARDFEADVPITWARLKGNSKYILIDKQGNQVKDISVDYIGNWKNGLCQVGILKNTNENANSYHYGFVNKNGDWVIPTNANVVGAAYYADDAVALEYANNSTGFGFFDINGDTLLPMQYKMSGAPVFHQGNALIENKGKYFLINKSGDTIAHISHGNAIAHADSMILVAFGKNYSNFGYIDYHNNVIIKGQYDRAENFHYNYAVVYASKEKGGIIDKQGNVIIPLQNQYVYNHADNGYFTTMNNDEWTYYSLSGQSLTPLDALIKANKGSVILPLKNKDNTYTYVDRQGNIVNQQNFCSAHPLSPTGVAIVEYCK